MGTLWKWEGGYGDGRCPVSGLQGTLSWLDRYIKLVSSVPIRNMATWPVISNASPMGILPYSSGLDAVLVLNHDGRKESFPCGNITKGTNNWTKIPAEYIELIRFNLPQQSDHFHFEKYANAHPRYRKL